MTDLEICKKSKLNHISVIAKTLNLSEDDIEYYGKYKAKINLDVLNRKSETKKNLILVTAINPTPAGEGKSTTTIGLADAIKSLGHNTCIALREPSMGPVFGLKGGACGGGYAQVLPMEDINLHFNGDFHAITAANNLISAILDNHLFQGNSLNIDPKSICFNRVLDQNDRALRSIVLGIGKKQNSVMREDHFDITVASEIMAILCLSNSVEDLKERIGKIVVGYTYNNEMVQVKDLGCVGAVAILLKDAIKPNLVQTIYHTPAIIHGGPFANIAHGCNSIIATKMALNLSDYVVTEAGFGADLGAEKFLDIKCRSGNLKPKCVVIVVTIRALKIHGGMPLSDVSNENLEALEKGLSNLEAHVQNIKKYNLNYVVAINKFTSDTLDEINMVMDYCNKNNYPVSLNESWEKGYVGAVNLANKVIEQVDKDENKFTYLYDEKLTIKQKINQIATKIYGAKDVVYSSEALKTLKQIKKYDLEHLLVCMAKTQYSLSDDPKLLGRPLDFTLNISNIKISLGANFVVVITKDILTMPGLPKHPAALDMDIVDDEIFGLF